MELKRGEMNDTEEREPNSTDVFLAAKAPYGFRRVKVEDDGAEYTSLEIDPQTGPVVRLIFSTNQDGATAVDIAKEFNQRGISSPTGDWWKPLPT